MGNGLIALWLPKMKNCGGVKLWGLWEAHLYNAVELAGQDSEGKVENVEEREGREGDRSI